MIETTRTPYTDRPPTQRPDPILDELRATRAELRQLRRLFDEYFGVFLNAKFPYGNPARFASDCAKTSRNSACSW